MARRQAEFALHESRSSLARAQEIAQLGNWTLDLTTGELRWSNEVYRIFGVTPETYSPTLESATVMFHPDDREPALAALQRAYQSNEPDTANYRIIRPDGAVRILHSRGEAVTSADGHRQVVGTVQDITARHEAEAQRDLLATAVEQAAEMILITDADGSIEYVNPAFERITGYTREEAIGQTPRLLKSGKHEDAFYTELWDIVSRGEVWAGNFINKRKDGSEYEEEAVISPVRDAQGQIVQFVKVMRDVTQERTLEQQLRQAQKMEAIGTLAGGIAHDFNNILTAILGFAELAQQAAPAGSDTAENINEVLTASARARALVAQILAFSRQQEVERQPMDIIPLLKEAMRLVRAGLPSTIEIRTDLPGSAVVEADPSEIHQALMNLATNAGQAMPEGGTLHVSVEHLDLDAAACAEHQGLTPGLYVCLTVRDTGCGMDADTLGRIFEPYFTTKAVGEGTGLGLAVVHGITKSLAGDVAVTSEPGAGTAFHLYLPAADAGPAAEARPLAAAVGGDEAVLLVDDEPQVQTVVQRALERLGYRVTTCGDGREALAQLHATPDEFAVVVTDKTMPHLTGFELTREIRRHWPHLPVLMCTGLWDRDLVERAQGIGVTELVMKPLTGTELGHAIRRILDAPRPTPSRSRTPTA